MNATRIVYGKHDRKILDNYSSVLAGRFWAKVDKSGKCWEWTAAKSNGYGVFYIGTLAGASTNVAAHRWAYLTAGGTIPPNHVLDHLCRNPACVNPSHLEPVTTQVNSERGLWGDLKTHCPAGHPYKGENIASRDNRRSRECRTCRSDQKIQARREKRALLAQNPGVVQHGNLMTYNDWMCRCQPCRDTAAAYQRYRRAKKAGLIQ